MEGYFSCSSELLDSLSRQMALSQLQRRHSRSSYTHAPHPQRTAVSTRIAKPASANSSPRGSMIKTARRKTFISDPYSCQNTSCPKRVSPQLPELEQWQQWQQIPQEQQVQQVPQLQQRHQHQFPQPEQQQLHPLPSFRYVNMPENPHLDLEYDPIHTSNRLSRPMSWHPGFQIPNHAIFPQPSLFQSSAFASPAFATPSFPTPPTYPSPDEFGQISHFSPLMAMAHSHSSSTSPISFSPLTLPLSDYDYLPQPDTFAIPNPHAPNQQVSLGTPNDFQLFPDMTNQSLCQSYLSPTPFFAAAQDSVLDAHPTFTAAELEWNALAMQGYGCGGGGDRTPLTPPLLPPYHQPYPAVPAVDQHDDDSGEILVGMGLYDAPEKALDDNPHFLYSRSSMSRLLASSGVGRRPMGKGLKLEETWQPPDHSSEGEEAEDDENIALDL